MKKYLYLLLIPLCMGFVACGSDDDPDPDPEPAPIDRLTEAQRKFLGYWHNKNGNADFLFNADGSCQCFYPSYPSDNTSGEWSYDESTKILSTTMDSYQWTITLSTDKSWAGVSLGGSGAQSFSHSDLFHLWSAYLLKHSWVRKDGKNPIDFRKGEIYCYDDNVQLNGNPGGRYYSSTFGFEIDFDYSLTITFDQNKDNSPTDYYEAVDLNYYMTSSKMVIDNCSFSDGQFTARFTQSVEYDVSYKLYEFYYESYEKEWYEIFWKDIYDSSDDYEAGTMSLVNPGSKDETLIVEVKGSNGKVVQYEYVSQ